MNIIACKAAGLLQDLQDPDPERIHLVRLHSMCATGKNFIFFFESAFPRGFLCTNVHCTESKNDELHT